MSELFCEQTRYQGSLLPCVSPFLLAFIETVSHLLPCVLGWKGLAQLLDSRFIAVCRTFEFDSMLYSLHLRQSAASPFSTVAVGCFCCCFLLVFAWMRTATLAGGIAVVRSGFLVMLRMVTW